MPEEDLNGEVRSVWERTKSIIISGNIVKKAGDKMVLSFPREAETKICHVRPHGKNSLDLAKLPKQDALTSFLGLPKQSFWLNHDYINKIIKQNSYVVNSLSYNIN